MHINNSKGFLINTIAGSLVLLTVLLGYFVHPAWLIFTGWIGFMLVLASITGFCPMYLILKKLGLKETDRVDHSSCCAECA